MFYPFFFTTTKIIKHLAPCSMQLQKSSPKRRCLSLKKASNMSWKASEVTFLKGRRKTVGWLVGWLTFKGPGWVGWLVGWLIMIRISIEYLMFTMESYQICTCQKCSCERIYSQTWFPQLQTNLVTQWSSSRHLRNSWLLHILRKRRSLSRLPPLPLAFCSTLKVHIALDCGCDLRHALPKRSDESKLLGYFSCNMTVLKVV